MIPFSFPELWEDSVALLISWEKKSRERDKKSLMRRGKLWRRKKNFPCLLLSPPLSSIRQLPPTSTFFLESHLAAKFFSLPAFRQKEREKKSVP